MLRQFWIYYHLLSSQAQYSLLCRSTEWELLEVCKREGIAMLPWSPLKGYDVIITPLSPSCSSHLPFPLWGSLPHAPPTPSPPITSLPPSPCYLTIPPRPPRGLLTGKFKRGAEHDPSCSRIAWVEADRNSRTNQSHPSLSHYANNEQFWQLLDTMREIAAAHGRSRWMGRES